MSLCLNDWQTSLPVPSILDLSSEIDRMTQPQSKGKGFSLGLREGTLCWCASNPATKPGNHLYGKYEFDSRMMEKINQCQAQENQMKFAGSPLMVMR